MHIVRVRNVNDALEKGLRLLSGSMALEESSRNGPVRVMPEPVMTVYEKPTERVLFSPVRDANPFFHLFEALWMLNGNNDLPWLIQFNSKFGAYSDDGGKTQPAAYGYRWRNYFGYDQLSVIVEELSVRPNSRRAVLAMWDGGATWDKGDEITGRGNTDDGAGDLHRAVQGSADVPCNTQCYFLIRNGALDMTVTCRSNDILWGAYGANAVHFSVLQEYIAACLGVPVGRMYQFSNNYHIYTDIIGGQKRALEMALDSYSSDFYGALEHTDSVVSMPMFADPHQFMRELQHFIAFAEHDGLMMYQHEDPWLRGVAVPMRAVWSAHKAKDYERAEKLCFDIRSPDWRVAAHQWIKRRAKRHQEKQS